MDLFEGLKSFRHINEDDAGAQPGLFVYTIDVDKLSEANMAAFVAELDHSDIRSSYENKKFQIVTDKSEEEMRDFLGKNDYTKDLPFEIASIKDWNSNLYASLDPETRESLAKHFIENDPENIPESLSKAIKEINDKLIVLDTKIQNSADETTDELLSSRAELEKQAGVLSSVNKSVSDILALLKAKKPIKKRGATKPHETVNEKLEKFMNTFTKQLDAVEKRRDKINKDLAKKFDDHSKEMAAKLDEMAKKDDIENLKIYMADELAKVNMMKQNNLITEDRIKELIKAINNAKTKTKMSDEELQKEAKLAKPAEVATKIYMWDRQVHKKADAVKEDYIFLAGLVAGLQKEYPDDYKELKKYLEESAKTKYGLIGAIEQAGDKASTEAEKKPAEAETKPEETKDGEDSDVEVDLGKKEKLKGNVYEYVFILKLGERKHYTNLEKLKVEEGTYHEEDLTPSIINKLSNMGHDLFGYEPQGYINAVIAKYADTRDFMGTLTQFTSKNSVGILASIAAGTGGFLVGKRKEFAEKGLDFGENIGKYIKYEMTGEVKDLNPVVADIENSIHDKFNIKERVRYDYENAKKRQEVTTKRRATTYLTTKGHPSATRGTPHPSITKKTTYSTLREDASAGSGGMGMEPVSPNPSGGFGSMGTSFNVPGMINGAGNPTPPTKDKPGSMDKFPIINTGKRRKKKKLRPKHLNEDILDFESFCKINK